MTSKSNWPQLRELVKTDDGLPVRDCGPWTEDKLFFWNEYVSIVTKAMVGNPAWTGGICYVDLFAGPGVCRIRDSLTRLPGSALVAAHAPKPFRHIHLAEIDPVLARACASRMEASPAKDRFTMHIGDSNQLAAAIAQQLPKSALTLVFVDPPSLDIHFEALRTMCMGRAVDLLILFADATDAVRNVDLYESIPESKLDKMMGDQDWKSEWRALDNQDGTNARKFFAQQYIARLRARLGYNEFQEHIIESRRGPMYRLIYASRNDRGRDFWVKATNKDSQGQRGLFG